MSEASEISIEDAWNLLFKEAVRRRLPMSPTPNKNLIAYQIMAGDKRFGVVDVSMQLSDSDGSRLQNRYSFYTGYYIASRIKIDESLKISMSSNKMGKSFKLTDPVESIVELAVKPALDRYLTLVEKLTEIIEKRRYKVEYEYILSRQVVKTERRVVRVVARDEGEALELLEGKRVKMNTLHFVNESKNEVASASGRRVKMIEKKGVTEWMEEGEVDESR